MSNTPIHPGIAALAAALTAVALSAASAQTEELDSHISSIKTQFQQLDTSAQACLADTLSDTTPGTTSDTTEACSEFLVKLDTVLPDYLQRCGTLLDWREQVVADSLDNDVPNDESLAQRLIDVEYTCGNDALVKRTNAVQAAFEKTRNPALGKLPSLVARSSNHQATQELLSNRNSTQQNVASQRLRLQGEIQQQWQRIQLENLREQNRQVRNYNDLDL